MIFVSFFFFVAFKNEFLGSASHLIYQINSHVKLSACLPYIRSRHGLTNCGTCLHIDFQDSSETKYMFKLCRLHVIQCKLILLISKGPHNSL